MTAAPNVRTVAARCLRAATRARRGMCQRNVGGAGRGRASHRRRQRVCPAGGGVGTWVTPAAVEQVYVSRQ